jgi:hypothetical protein
LEVVEKKSMYGYFPYAMHFIKVSLYNPEDVKSLIQILEVMNHTINHPSIHSIPFICLPFSI